MTDQTPWHAAFPAPETTAPLLSRTAALPLVASGDPSLLLIDVRRTDYEGGATRGSLNRKLPTHATSRARALTASSPGAKLLREPARALRALSARRRAYRRVLLREQ
jgi:hypothetical protein